MELIVVVAIVGIVAAILPMTARRDHIQTRQAAKLLAQQIQLSRFEAVKRNRFAGVYFPADGLSFTTYEDTNNDRSYGTGDTVISTYQLGVKDYSHVKLNLTAAQSVLFDPRSFLYTTGSASAVTVFNLQSTADPNYKWKVEVTTQGRVIRVIQ